MRYIKQTLLTISASILLVACGGGTTPTPAPAPSGTVNSGSSTPLQDAYNTTTSRMKYADVKAIIGIDNNSVYTPAACAVDETVIAWAITTGTLKEQYYACFNNVSSEIKFAAVRIFPGGVYSKEINKSL